MRHEDDYFDYILRDNPNFGKRSYSVNEKIAFEILRDVTDRKGWKHPYDEFDDDVREEILETWLSIINKLNPDQPYPSDDFKGV